jgi:hypothetical protein
MSQQSDSMNFAKLEHSPAWWTFVLVIHWGQRREQAVFMHVAEEGLLKFDEPKPAAVHDPNLSRMG